MPHEGFTAQHRVLGRTAAWGAFLVGRRTPLQRFSDSSPWSRLRIRSALRSSLRWHCCSFSWHP
jgi:hypothetical protein